MDVVFNKNSLKPGDPGFIYDKVEEFVPTIDNDWDMDDDEDIIWFLDLMFMKFLKFLKNFTYLK